MFEMIASAGTLKSVVYIAAAVIPALFLMVRIYKADRVEKESPFLLITLIACGVGAAFIAVFLEGRGERILIMYIGEGSRYYAAALAFLVIAVSEEGAKLALLSLRTWRGREFNYRFDGIVYAVFVSLGFAAYENIFYVFSFGLSTAIMRALVSIPGHFAFAVFMGLFYGRARMCANRGDGKGRTFNLVMAFLSSVFLHGFFNTCVMIGDNVLILTFIVFVVLMYIVVIHLVKRESAADRPL